MVEVDDTPLGIRWAVAFAPAHRIDKLLSSSVVSNCLLLELPLMESKYARDLSYA